MQQDLKYRFYNDIFRDKAYRKYEDVRWRGGKLCGSGEKNIYIIRIDKFTAIE
jgi:hypothetical protein